MKVEIVKLPERPHRSNANWLKCRQQVLQLRPSLSVKIEGLDKKEVNALRQQAYREEGIRSFTRIVDGRAILYLYKRGG